MAMLGIGDYLCEACRWFNTDGEDGWHPRCYKQDGLNDMAIRLGEDCPFGYEFGVPSGYPVSMKRNEERAYEVKAMNGKHAKVVGE